MSLQSRLGLLITAIGADIKNHATLVGDRVSSEPTPGDSGFNDWNQSPYNCNTGSAPTAGQLFVCRMVNRNTSALTISSVTVLMAAVGASLTNVGFGLYSAAGNLLTSSVNANGATTTAFGTVNPRTVTFTPQSIAARTAYYVGFWFSGTTAPQLYRSSGTNFVVNVGMSAPNYRFATTSNTGLTSTAPTTLGTMTFSGTAFFVATA